MGYAMFSDDWAKAYQQVLSGSEAYRKAAEKWEWPLVLRAPADTAGGQEPGHDQAVYLDLWHGVCREARAATAQDLSDAPYVISGDIYTWKQVLDKQIEPITGLMRGKLKLTRGSLITLAGYVQAARQLVEAATQVATDFPGGNPL
jgi:putative sterol carrier protein